MTITITTPGDPSVGVQGELVTIEWPYAEEALEEDDLREFRADLVEFWESWLSDGPVTVEFSTDPSDPLEEAEDGLNWEPYAEV